MDVLLGASDLSEFSDRLEFMGALAQNDADLATPAENAQQQAQWAAERYAETIEEKTAELDQMQAKRAEIERCSSEQQALVEQLDREYRDYIERAGSRRPRRRRPPRQAAADDTGTSGGGDTTGGGGGYAPPPERDGRPDRDRRRRLEARRRVRLGHGRPRHVRLLGAHDAGRTRRPGVYLPHSSAAQASSVRRRCRRCSTRSPATCSSSTPRSATSRSTSAAAR